MLLSFQEGIVLNVVANSHGKADVVAIQVPEESVTAVELGGFKTELLSQEELFLKLAGDMPKEMIFMRELLISRL